MTLVENNARLRTKTQAKAILNCSDSTIDRYMRLGFLRFVKLADGRSGGVRFDQDDLNAFIERRKRGGEAA